MNERDQLVKFISKLEPISKGDFTKEGVEAVEKAVQEFYEAVPVVKRSKIQSNALQILSNNVYKITTGINDLNDFKQAFHSICQLSTEYFDESGDPMMLIAYLGILSEYFLKKDITKEQ